MHEDRDVSMNVDVISGDSASPANTAIYFVLFIQLFVRL